MTYIEELVEAITIMAKPCNIKESETSIKFYFETEKQAKTALSYADFNKIDKPMGINKYKFYSVTFSK